MRFIKFVVLSMCLVILILTLAGKYVYILDKPPQILPAAHQDTNQQVVTAIHKNSRTRRELLGYLKLQNIKYDDVVISELSEAAQSLQEVVSGGFPKGASSFVAFQIPDTSTRATFTQRTMLQWRFFYDKTGKVVGMRNQKYTDQKFRS